MVQSKWGTPGVVGTSNINDQKHKYCVVTNGTIGFRHGDDTNWCRLNCITQWHRTWWSDGLSFWPLLARGLWWMLYLCTKKKMSSSFNSCQIIYIKKRNCWHRFRRQPLARCTSGGALCRGADGPRPAVGAGLLCAEAGWFMPGGRMVHVCAEAVAFTTAPKSDPREGPRQGGDIVGCVFESADYLRCL
jgi:hypothetical protein